MKVLQFLFKCLLAVVFLAFALEISLRIVDPSGHEIWEANAKYKFTPVEGSMPGVYGPSAVTINSMGLRGDEMPDDATFKVLAVGASTTGCYNLDDSETWPHLLQEQLQAAYPDEKVWVANAGRPNTTLVQNYYQLEVLLDEIPDVDLVVLMSGGIELVRGLGTHIGAGAARKRTYEQNREIYRLTAFNVYPVEGWSFDSKGSELYRRLSILYNSLRHTGATGVGDGTKILKARATRQEGKTFVDEIPDLTYYLDIYKKEMLEVEELVLSSGAQLLYLQQPTLVSENMSDEAKALIWGGRYDLGEEEATKGPGFYSGKAFAKGYALYGAAMQEVCDTSRAECFDMNPELGHSTEYFIDQVHFNEAGAVKIADAVSGFIIGHQYVEQAAK